MPRKEAKRRTIFGPSKADKLFEEKQRQEKMQAKAAALLVQLDAELARYDRQQVKRPVPPILEAAKNKRLAVFGQVPSQELAVPYRGGCWPPCRRLW